MLYVYSTPDFDKKIKRDFKDLQKCIDTLRKRIENKQAYTGFVPFNEGFYVKKKLQYQYRLIARSKTVEIDGEEHELLVLHDLMIRSDLDYNNPNDPHCFCQDPEGYARKHQYVKADHDKLCYEYCQRRLQEQNVVKPKQLPSDYEYEILHAPLVGKKEKNGNLSIYEMKEWVESLKSEKNADDLLNTFLHRLYENVVDAVASSAASDKNEACDVQTVEYGTGHKKYFSYYYNIDELVFILGRIDDTEKEARDFLNENENLFKQFDEKKILKRIARSYPETIVQNEEDHSLWQNIEQEKSNNMALSPEELDILNSILDSETRKYPLFINGRAGSGKSTILQFLFTSYYFKYLSSTNDQDASPVYFTYNEKLLTNARETVDSLLNNHDYIGGLQPDDPEKQRLETKKNRAKEKVFRNFSAFLLEIAKNNKKKIPLLLQKKMDFQKFKELWENQFRKERELCRKVTPEICWHVIRTYIKGDSVEALMDTDEYKASPSHSIPVDLFKTIYDKIWPWYSQLTLFRDNGNGCFGINPRPEYWDDQDLVRLILMEDEEQESSSLLDEYFDKNPRFSAIFCDESQDFTHMELEAILEMSLYLYRKVDQNYIDKIPFVFAGDPFQTLNPTGFSWEATKSGFVDKIARVLDKKAEHVDLNYKELKMNYRSESDIVKFSNAIQIIRASKLNPEKHLIEPQFPWNETKGACLFFEWSNTDLWHWLEKNENVSFILPCESSDKANYIRNNNYLREHICRSDGGYKYPVFSAQDIKGLEYDKVVVFGFGNYDNSDERNGKFKQLLEKESIPTNTSNLELEYFINRLYVAVTRPRKQLFILDEPKSTFWDKLKVKAGNEAPIIEWLTSLVPKNCMKAWEKNGNIAQKFSIPVLGRSSELSGEISGEKKEAFAEQLLLEGIDNRDTERLDVALQRFCSIRGDSSQKCDEIRGCISYLKQDFQTAAEKFKTAGKKIAANHCFFLALQFPLQEDNEILKKMKDLSEDPDCEDSVEWKMAAYCSEIQSGKRFLEIFRLCIDNFPDYSKKSGHDIFSWDKDSEQWEKAFNNILSKLNNVSLSAEELGEIKNKISSQTLFLFDEKVLIDFYFSKGLYDDVIDMEYPDMGDTLVQVIRRAKAYKLGFPKNLSILNENSEFDTIAEIYKDHYKSKGSKIAEELDTSAINIIYKAKKQKKNAIGLETLTCLFGKSIDTDIWSEYYGGLKEKSYQQQCVQLLCDFIKKRTDDKFTKNILEKLRKNANFNSKESFNLFYLCCLGIANEHPVAIDLGICSSAMKEAFKDAKVTIEENNLSLNDILQFGRFYEYIVSLCKKEEDKPRYWNYVIQFYNDVLKTKLIDTDQSIVLHKRIIYAKEQLAEIYHSLSRKRGLRRSEIDIYLRQNENFKKEAYKDRRTFAINDKIESLPNKSPDNILSQTLKEAAVIWQNNGFIVRKNGVIEDVSNEETKKVTETKLESIVPEKTVPNEPEEKTEAIVEEPKEQQIDEPKLETDIQEQESKESEIEQSVNEADAENDAEQLDEAVETEPEIEQDPLQTEFSENNFAESEKEIAIPIIKKIIEDNNIDSERSDEQTQHNDIELTPLAGEAPQKLHIECGGYIINGDTEDDDYCVTISTINTSGKEIKLGEVNSYGFSPKKQKNFEVNSEPFYKYGELDEFKVELIENDSFIITIGKMSLRIGIDEQ